MLYYNLVFITFLPHKLLNFRSAERWCKSYSSSCLVFHSPSVSIAECKQSSELVSSVEILTYFNLFLLLRHPNFLCLFGYLVYMTKRRMWVNISTIKTFFHCLRPQVTWTVSDEDWYRIFANTRPGESCIYCNGDLYLPASHNVTCPFCTSIICIHLC